MLREIGPDFWDKILIFSAIYCKLAFRTPTSWSSQFPTKLLFFHSNISTFRISEHYVGKMGWEWVSCLLDNVRTLHVCATQRPVLVSTELHPANLSVFFFFYFKVYRGKWWIHLRKISTWCLNNLRSMVVIKRIELAQVQVTSTQF